MIIIDERQGSYEVKALHEATSEERAFIKKSKKNKWRADGELTECA